MESRVARPSSLKANPDYLPGIVPIWRVLVTSEPTLAVTPRWW